MTGPVQSGRATGAARGAGNSGGGADEAYRGLRTTELVLAVVAAAAVVIASYASGTATGSFPIRLGWLFYTVILSAYIVSRGIAKAGSRRSG